MNKYQAENRGINEELFDELYRAFIESPSLLTMDMHLLYIGSGTAGIKMSAQYDYSTVAGRLHGGIIATLADTAMGWAVISLGRPCVTVEMNLNYVAPVFQGTEMIAHAKVIHAGKNTVITEAELSAQGTLVAKSRGTFFISSGKDNFGVV